MTAVPPISLIYIYQTYQFDTSCALNLTFTITDIQAQFQGAFYTLNYLLFYNCCTSFIWVWQSNKAIMIWLQSNCNWIYCKISYFFYVLQLFSNQSFNNYRVRTNRIEWTEWDQIGSNKMEVDWCELIGPNRSNVDWIRPMWTEWTELDRNELNKDQCGLN